jgi:polyhydroxyalkanoate synthesis repressor PhaR
MPQKRVIKKYPNRRLYDTSTSAYITLVEVKQMVLESQNFVVQDAKTGEDLTRAILLQIILEEEAGGVPMFSADMLANIIRYYGHSMQGLMGVYLERSINAFSEAQRKFQEQSSKMAGEFPALNPTLLQEFMHKGPADIPGMMQGYIERSATAVIGMQEELSKQAFKLFGGFPYGGEGAVKGEDQAPEASANEAPKPKTRRTK